ncbi:hypothetical protein [Streptomyces sp. NPDC002671]
MKSTTVRRTALSIAMVAALTGVAACGGSDSGKGDKGDKAAGGTPIHVDPIAALRSAEKSTQNADSAKVQGTTSIGTMMTMDASGALTWGHGLKGSLTMTYTGGQMGEAMRKAGSASMEARYLPDAYYVKMSDKFAQRMGGKHWLRYGYDDLAKLGGGSGAYVKDQMQNSSPNQSVKMLLASGDVKKAGEETVAGQHTTHYAGTVNIADLADRSNHNLTASQLADMKAQLTKAGITTEHVDLWINDQNLLVKKIEKADMKNGPMVSTATYSDYGVKVTAVAPPTSDTKDFGDLLKSGGAASGSSTGSGTGTMS